MKRFKFILSCLLISGCATMDTVKQYPLKFIESSVTGKYIIVNGREVAFYFTQEEANAGSKKNDKDYWILSKDSNQNAVHDYKTLRLNILLLNKDKIIFEGALNKNHEFVLYHWFLKQPFKVLEKRDSDPPNTYMRVQKFKLLPIDFIETPKQHPGIYNRPAYTEPGVVYCD